MRVDLFGEPDEGGIPRLSLTPSEAARSLGVTLEFFRGHVQPALRTVDAGDLELVPTAELQRWLASDPNEPVLTLSEAAERLQVSERTVLRAIRAGDLAASQLNRRGGWRIYDSALREWMEFRATTPRRQQPTPAARRVDPTPRTTQRPRHDSNGRLTP